MVLVYGQLSANTCRTVSCTKLTGILEILLSGRSSIAEFHAEISADQKKTLQF
jgi:hypothetical protein